MTVSTYSRWLASVLLRISILSNPVSCNTLDTNVPAISRVMTICALSVCAMNPVYGRNIPTPLLSNVWSSVCLHAVNDCSLVGGEDPRVLGKRTAPECVVDLNDFYFACGALSDALERLFSSTYVQAA